MKKIILTTFAVLLIIPSVTYAVWWNPLTWFNSWGKGEVKKEVIINRDNSQNYNQTQKTNTDNTYCDGVFDKIITKIGANYDSCVEGLNFSSDCKLPDGANTSYNKINIAIILDSSGSMEGTISGQKKIAIAKKAVIDFVSSLPKEINVSLIAYGHKGSNSDADKAVSCAGVETIYPLSPLNTADFISKVNSFSPKGWTPLASAIKQAQTVLQTGGINNKNIIYVVSDGLETCGGDPAKIASEVNKSNSKVEVNIIGFAVNNDEQTKLKEAAVSGGGKFYLANNSSDLNKVFSDNKVYLNGYLSCNNAAVGRLSVDSSALTGRVSVCFSSAIGRESMDFGMEARKLSRSDSDLCYKSIMDKLSKRQQTVYKMQDDLNSKNSDSFSKSLKDLKSNATSN